MFSHNNNWKIYLFYQAEYRWYNDGEILCGSKNIEIKYFYLRFRRQVNQDWINWDTNKLSIGEMKFYILVFFFFWKSIYIV